MNRLKRAIANCVDVRAFVDLSTIETLKKEILNAPEKTAEDIKNIKFINKQSKSPEKWTVDAKIKLYDSLISTNNINGIEDLAKDTRFDIREFPNDSKLNFYKIAIKNNNLAIVRFLHETLRININVQDQENGYTPLFYAAMYLKDEPVPVIVQNADRIIIPLDGKKSTLETSEHIILANPDDTQTFIIKYLLENKANYNHQSKNLSNLTALHAAARKGNVKFLLVLYDWLKGFVFTYNKFLTNVKLGDKSVIHEACKAGSLDFIDILERILAKEDFLEILVKEDLSGNNCLHLASYRGNKDIINKIMKYNPSILIEKQNTKHLFPLDVYIESLIADSEKSSVFSLIEHICPKSLLQEDKLPFCLELSVKNNYIKIFSKIVDMLSKEGNRDDFYAKLIRSKNSDGENIFHIIGESDSVEIAQNLVDICDKSNNEELLNTLKKTLVTKDNFDCLPIVCSVYYGKIRTFNFLFEILKKYGQLTIDNMIDSINSCVMSDYDELLEFILKDDKLKNEYFEYDLSTESELRESDNSIHIISRKNSVKCFDLLVKEFGSLKVFNCLLRRNSEDMLPINKAIQANNLEIIEKYLEFCDKNSFNARKMLEMPNEDLNASMHFAAESGNVKIIELLLYENVDLELKNFENKTSIDILCKKGFLNCLKKVFEISQDFTLKDINLKNAIKLAIENHQAAIIEYLLRIDKEILESNLIKLKFSYEYIEIHEKSSIKDTGKNNLNENNNNKEIEDSENIVYQTKETYEQNVLDLAIRCGDEEITKIIIDSADMDELETLLVNVRKIGARYMLTFWELIEKMPKAAEMCLDKYMDLQDGKKKYELDFLMLDQMALIDKHSQLSSKLSNISSLNIMADNNLEELLEHPFVKIYMRSKWNFIAKLVYFGGLALYLTYVVLLTTLVILHRDDGYKIEVLSLFVFSIACVLFLKEIFQLISLRFKYFSFENTIEITSFVSSILMNFPVFEISNDFRVQAACVAVIFSYIVLGFYSKRLPKIGKYTSAVMQVSETIVKFMLSMSIYLIGFSIAFYLLCRDDKLDYKWSWILRSAFMMMGDFSFDDIVESTDYQIKYFILALFIIALPIVLNNLLISFSISDTKKILDNAALQTIKTEIEFMSFSGLFSARKKTILLNSYEENIFVRIKEMMIDSKESIIKNADHRSTVLYKWRLQKDATYKNTKEYSAISSDLTTSIVELDKKIDEIKDHISGKRVLIINNKADDVLSKISGLDRKFESFKHEIIEVNKNVKKGKK